MRSTRSPWTRWRSSNKRRSRWRRRPKKRPNSSNDVEPPSLTKSMETFYSKISSNKIRMGVNSAKFQQSRSWFNNILFNQLWTHFLHLNSQCYPLEKSVALGPLFSAFDLTVYVLWTYREKIIDTCKQLFNSGQDEYQKRLDEEKSLRECIKDAKEDSKRRALLSIDAYGEKKALVCLTNATYKISNK